MSDLVFQYIGYGCVFLASLRIMDVTIHVVLGVVLKLFRLDTYYYFAVDALSYKRKIDYTSVTGTKDD